MKKIPQHQKINDYIMGLISELKPGAMLPTETALAEKFKVSRLTVHKVMANLQRDGIVQRIKGKGTFLTKETKEIIKFGPNQKNGTIIIAYPDWFSEDIYFKVSLAERLANQNKMNTINLKLMASPDYKVFSQMLKANQNVKGIVLIPPGAEMDMPSLKYLDSLNIPIVILVPTQDYALFKNIYVVTVDNFELGLLSIDHLIANGHRKIGYVTNEPWGFSSKQMFAGMKRSVQANSLKQNSLVKPSSYIKPGDDSMKSGFTFTKEILENNSDVTALIFDSLPGVIGGMSYLHEQRISIPDDLSLICCAEYGSFEDYLCSGVTTVYANREKILARAIEIILDPGNVDQKQFLINAEIKLRKTVKNI